MVQPVEQVTLVFGSRAGSWFALCLFAALFGSLAFAVSRELHRRPRPVRPVATTCVGVLLFLVPVLLIYATSLGGFYEADVDDRVLRLHYLLGATSEVPLSEVKAVRTVPSYRGRWRLEITSASAKRYKSATWHQRPVAESARLLRSALTPWPRPSKPTTPR
jgi:hypothetical protein